MTNRGKTLSDLHDALLMDYATGALDNTLSLLVASQMALCAATRRRVTLYETLGGVVIEECCEPVAMRADSLASVLGHLEAEQAETPCETITNILHDLGCALPAPLRQHLVAQACHRKKWRQARGVHVIALPPREQRRVLLVRGKTGAAIPHTASEEEYILVLQGRLRDHGGTYTSGDLLIPAEDRPVVDSREGSVCLVVADGARARPSWLRQIFPFW